MKKILLTCLLFASCLSAFSQIDSAAQTITVLLPVKAIKLHGYKLSSELNWTQRKAPDALLPLIGSGNNLDSVVTVVVKAGVLADFVRWLLWQPYGAGMVPIRSILSNVPSITGYTALTSQITTKANGNTSEKAAATYIIGRYNIYIAELTDAYNQALANGEAWIRN